MVVYSSHMTTTGETSAAAPPERRDRTIAAATGLLLLIGMPIAYFSGDTSTGDVIGFFVLTALSLALTAWLVLWLAPRERAAGPERATRTALTLGVLALLADALFWTGLPFPLGAGAIVLGLWLRERPAPSGSHVKATTAVALGAFAEASSFVALLVG
jgi:peptidoglycan/LPS O-acetylase OafA/YrhL